MLFSKPFTTVLFVISVVCVSNVSAGDVSFAETAWDTKVFTSEFQGQRVAIFCEGGKTYVNLAVRKGVPYLIYHGTFDAKTKEYPFILMEPPEKTGSSRTTLVIIGRENKEAGTIIIDKIEERGPTILDTPPPSK